MTFPADILDDLAAFKAKLRELANAARVERKKRKLLEGIIPRSGPNDHHEGPASKREPKPRAVLHVGRSGKTWLLVAPTGAATRGLKPREDPVVRDAPITQAPYNVSHMTGNTARICNDLKLFKRPKETTK